MTARWIRRGLMGGALGGVLMAMVEMTNELMMGHSLFTPMHMIAAPVVGMSPMENAMRGGPFYVEPTPALLGMIGHFMWAAVVWGIVFGLLAAAGVRTAGVAALLWGAVYGLATGFAMSIVVLPLVGFPPLWEAAGWPAFILMHIAYGLGPGIAMWLAARRGRETAPVRVDTAGRAPIAR